jgi:hypothetical protein
LAYDIAVYLIDGMNQTLHARQTMSLYRYHKSISRAFVGSSHGGGSLSSELSVRSGAKRLIQAAGGFKCRHIDALCDSRPHTEGMRRLLRSTSNSAVEAPTTAEVSADLPQLTLQDLPTSDQSEKMLRVRHSCAHIMAMAVQKLFKGAQCTIGPWIDHGFYYDFDMEEPLTRKSLPRIKKEMQKIIKKKLPFIREEVSAEEARARIEAIGEPYKLEI